MVKIPIVRVEAVCPMCNASRVIDSTEDSVSFVQEHESCLNAFELLSETEKEEKLKLARPAQTLRPQ